MAISTPGQITAHNAPVSPSTSFADIRQEYVDLFDRMQILPSKRVFVEQQVDRVAAAKPRYQSFVATLGAAIPWHGVALIHSMEKGSDVGKFLCHLHNGDPLSERTVHVPAHRPPPSVGDPPFSWEVSARDALDIEGFLAETDWSIPRLLYLLEKYNGFGSRRYHRIATAYLWSFSDLYASGKYVADNTWDPAAVSMQVGAATILKSIAARGLLDP